METQGTKHQQQVVEQLRGTMTIRASLPQALCSSVVEAIAVMVRLLGHSVSLPTQAIATATAVSALSLLHDGEDTSVSRI